TRFIIVAISLIFGCNSQNDSSFKFEKLIFHLEGDGCEGFCPTYHLQIDSSKNVLLYSETVWKETSDRFEALDSYIFSVVEIDGIIIDSIRTKLLNEGKDKSKMGYFTGEVNDSNYQNPTFLLSKANLHSITLDKNTCCDGLLQTLIIDYNKKTKHIETMFPPDSLEPL